MAESNEAHWNQVYGSRAATDVSWYEAHPARSLEFIRAAGIRPDEAIIDVGGGASILVEELFGEGYRDLTILDISAEALRTQRERLGRRGIVPTLIQEDVTRFRPQRSYALWHDRAVFHFLVQPEDRLRYVDVLGRALRPGGHAIIATFGPSGPERCSGLSVARYDAQALAGELGAGFALIDSALHLHRTPRGAEQQFLYARFDRRE